MDHPRLPAHLARAARFEPLGQTGGAQYPRAAAGRAGPQSALARSRQVAAMWSRGKSVGGAKAVRGKSVGRLWPVAPVTMIMGSLARHIQGPRLGAPVSSGPQSPQGASLRAPVSGRRVPRCWWPDGDLESSTHVPCPGAVIRLAPPSKDQGALIRSDALGPKARRRGSGLAKPAKAGRRQRATGPAGCRLIAARTRRLSGVCVDPERAAAKCGDRAAAGFVSAQGGGRWLPGLTRVVVALCRGLPGQADQQSRTQGQLYTSAPIPGVAQST